MAKIYHSFFLALILVLLFSFSASATVVDNVMLTASSSAVYIQTPIGGGGLTPGHAYRYTIDITLDIDYYQQYGTTGIYPRFTRDDAYPDNAYTFVVEGTHILYDYTFYATSSAMSSTYYGLYFEHNPQNHFTANFYRLMEVTPRANSMPIFNPQIYEKQLGSTQVLTDFYVGSTHADLPSTIVTGSSLRTTSTYIRIPGEIIGTNVLTSADVNNSTFYNTLGTRVVTDLLQYPDYTDIVNAWGDLYTTTTYIPYLICNKFPALQFYPSDALLVNTSTSTSYTFTPSGGIVYAYPDAESLDFTMQIGLYASAYTSCTVSGVSADVVFDGHSLVLHCHADSTEFDLSDMSITINVGRGGINLYSLTVSASEADSALIGLLSDIRLDISSGLNHVYYATVGVAQSLYDNLQDFVVGDDADEAVTVLASNVDSASSAQSSLQDTASTYLNNFTPDPSGLTGIVPAFGVVAGIMTNFYNRFSDFQVLVTFFLTFSVILFALQMRR